MKLTDFDYELPQELIAQSPSPVRDESRLLVLDRNTGQIEHRKFRDIVEYLTPNDCLVMNDSKVIPARLFGKRKDTGAAIELLLQRNVGGDVWETMVRPGRRAKPGHRLIFQDGILEAEVLDLTDSGTRIVRFEYSGVFLEILEKIGKTPLPPYIKNQSVDSGRYQTVYARYPGSSAAPTAGLHFTPELLERIADKGISLGYVTLHVGLGTFRPVKVMNITEHRMHSEHYFVPKETADIVNSARARGGRVVCVGTTSCRTLETAADEGVLRECEGWTDIFIYPGYVFKMTDALITNFHLPQSTLLMLVSAFAGHDRIMEAYRQAVAERYRFFSFGDAMFIK